MRIVFRAKALGELEAIERYIAAENPHAAARLIAEIRRKVERLADHPLSAPVGPRPGTRCLVVSGSPYLVIYTVRSGAVIVLGVIHGSRSRRF